MPLDLSISRFGSAEPSGARRFSIKRVEIGGQNQTLEPVKDSFAPGQFLRMTDEEVLSRPSFELMNAGVGIKLDDVLLPEDLEDRLEVEAVEFENIVIDRRGVGLTPTQRHPEVAHTPSLAQLSRHARLGAAGRTELRRAGEARFRTEVKRHKVVPEGWSIVSTEDLKVQVTPDNPKGDARNYSRALAELNGLREKDAASASRLKILRLSELKGAPR